MEFALNEDQRLLQDSMGKFLEGSCPLDKVREIATSDAPDAPLWEAFAQLGGAGLLIEEAYGGVGVGLLEAALVAECLGHAAAPLPFLSNAVAAPLALAACGTDEQKTQYLPPLAAGKLRMASALTIPPAAMTVDGGKLKGRTLFCLDAGGAAHYLVALNDAFYLVQADDPAVRVNPMPTIDKTRAVSELVLDGAPAEQLGTAANPAAVARVLLATRIALAADSLGAASAMLTKARDYALERKQFNRIIGSFQAVKHMCAEMASQLEPCRALIWYGAHAFDQDLDDAAMVGLYAKAHLGDVGKFVARTATEVHGGMGFTDLLGLHYWFKRLGFNRQALGSPERLREAAAQNQGWV